MKRSTGTVLQLLMAVLAFLFVQCGNDTTPQLKNKKSIKKVIAAMTLEEKAYFVTGTGMDLPEFMPDDSTVQTPGAPVIGETKSLVPGAAGTSYPIPRLGIPAIVMTDGPAGVRISPQREGDSLNTYYCTAFPVATLLASTWDTDLVYQVGQSMGNEVLEYGADILLAPALNIHRNPLCGRNFEYYSEDPFVTGKMAAAMVNGVESQGVGTSIKHYAANNAETNRNALNTIVSERALHEIYLEGFRIAVQEAQPWTVMSSYNLINDTMASESYDLLTKVLRNDWGFEGFVMTDWYGGRDATAQMKAGNDLLMPGTFAQAEAIITAVKEGKLDEAVLDRNIERILNILVESPNFKGYQSSNKPDLKAHAEVTRQAATEGIILLKNDDNTLPMTAETKSIAVFGHTSYDIISGGTGSGDVNEEYTVSLIEGIEGAGYEVNEELNEVYETYVKDTKEKMPPVEMFMPEPKFPEMPVSADLADQMASTADIALITLGRNSGEMRDREENDDFNITDAEKTMLESVTTAFHAAGKKVIVILNIAGVIETASWRDIPDAILLVWQGGQETGNSIADVISGKVNPSGKLATTFPVKYSDVPSSNTFPGQVTEEIDPDAPEIEGLRSFFYPKESEIIYEDGIYVGYRYYETFGIPVAYEFGYGLSYTEFEYSKLQLSSENFDNTITVAVDIENTGGVAGKEVVQLYISAPSKSIDKPVIELKGFAKTGLLMPGESQTLSFDITAHNLASFIPESSQWMAEEGDYEVMIGASSKDIRLIAPFTLDSEVIVEQVSTALAPKTPVNELKPVK